MFPSPPSRRLPPTLLRRLRSASSSRRLHIHPRAFSTLPSPSAVVSAPLQTHRRHPRLGSFHTSSSSSPPSFSTPSRCLSTASDGETSDRPTATSKPFQAETRELLDLVIHSLYTDKEVFLRELVSNASDACEKMRHLASTGALDGSDEVPLEIHIATDKENNTLTISDSGCGMTAEEMEKNLGTIAHSGSKAFLSEIVEGGGDAKSIIGKFGVGFYSSFMVAGAKGVEVVSRSASLSQDAPYSVWSSDGIGSYTIDSSSSAPSLPQSRGTAITIHLSDETADYADAGKVEAIIKKYSNFVTFPIHLDGERVNTVDAVWARDPGSEKIEDETYDAFYKYVANAYDEPMYRLHYRADAPVDIRALFFVPTYHTEKYGMGHMEPGVSLYSRKVLIEAKSPDILPEWMRFVKGVVDSEDLPLSVSRERAQDSALIQKLRTALTKRFTSFLAKMARKDPEKYKTEFFPEFGQFLKEGVCRDYPSQDALSKLLYFDSSKCENGETTSFEEYVGRCTPDQKEIYYLVAPNREAALNSPYFEIFLKADREVFFVYTAMDDFVMTNLGMFQSRKLVSAEKGEIDLPDDSEKDAAAEAEEKDVDPAAARLTDVQTGELCAWLETEALPDRLAAAKVTHRLSMHPAIVVGHESGAMRRMMLLVNQRTGGEGTSGKLPKQTLEVNPSHPIVVGLHALRESDEDLAVLCAQQLLDNAIIEAGLMDEGGRDMLPRLNEILMRLTAKKDSDI